MTHDAARALIDARFVDGLDPAQTAELRAHLRDCAACRAYYDRIAELEQALGGDAAVNARLHALGAPAPASVSPPSTGGSTAPRRRGWLIGLAAAAALALGVGLLLRPAPPAYTVKSGGGAVTATIRLFRQSGDGTVHALDTALTRGEGVLVSYTNPKDGPSHLGVVARDASGALRWLQPAWTDAAARPTAVPIAQGVADRELPQVVHHALPAGPLEICAIFLDEPRAVPAWDVELSAAWPPPDATCRQVTVR